MMRRQLAAVVVVVAGLSMPARADIPPDDPPTGCSGKNDGDTCQLTKNGMIVTGVCMPTPCPMPGDNCLFCAEQAATTGDDPETTTGSASSTGSVGSTGAVGDATPTSGASSGGDSNPQPSEPEAKGCGCRSDAAPGPSLALVVLGLFAWRRRIRAKVRAS